MEIIVDDADPRIEYSTKLPALRWEPNFLCREHCAGLEDVRGEVEAKARNGTWHTTRGGARQSNATLLSFEGSRVAASFILFQRDVQDVASASVAEAKLMFYVDGQLQQTPSDISWSKILKDPRIRILPGDRFVNAVLFNQAVSPGKHSFTIQYDTGDMTERDTSLALDYIRYTELVASPSPSPSSTAASSSSSKLGIIIGGVIGALAFLGILLGFLTYWWLKRQKLRQRHRVMLSGESSSINDSAQSRYEKILWSPALPGAAEMMVSPPSPSRPASAVSFTTLSSLSIFSRPGSGLHGLPSPATRPSTRSIRASVVSSSLSYTSYEQQWQGLGALSAGSRASRSAGQ